MIIAFMGNDGSGKTTIAKELTNVFKEWGLKVIYKHEYEYSVLKFLFKIIGMDKINQERKKMIIERKKSWKYYVWPFLVWFDVSLQYLYLKIFRRNAIVILDRYPYDHYLSFDYLGYLTPLSRWLYLHFPKPDIGIILWVEPEVAYERKKSTHNYSLSFYERQTKNYLSLARKFQIPSFNTNKDKEQTVNEVVSFILQTKPGILYKLIQNKIIFFVLKKHKLKSGIFKRLWDEHKRRKEMFRRSLKAFKTLCSEMGIQNYALIKTSDDFEWVGNDIDVLVSPSAFKILQNISETIRRVFVEEIKHDRWDAGKMDIFIKDGLKLDIHSYIGWRNVVFLNYSQILREEFIQKKTIFDVECVTVKKEIDSIIIITHIFEKGFITLDEYEFLKKHFDESFMQANFPHLCILLSDYVSWITKILREKRNYSYPLFIPISIMIRSYSKLFFYLKNGHSDAFWKIKAFVRDISLITFWRIRYVLKDKLPFEVLR
jgi:thymidylate kinase